MGTSVELSYVEKLHQDIEKACRSLEEIGYDSLVIIVSQDRHIEMGSKRGREYLNVKSNYIQQFFQYCRDNQQKQKITEEKLNTQDVDGQISEPVLLNSNRSKVRILRGIKVETLSTKRQVDTLTNVRQAPTVRVIEPSQRDDMPGSNTSEDDSDHSGVLPSVSNNQNISTDEKPRHATKGCVLPKNSIIVINDFDVQKSVKKIDTPSALHTETVVPMKVTPVMASVVNMNTSHQEKLSKRDILTSSLSLRKTYNCDQCDKKYARNEDLIIHKRKHSGELPYSCRTCGRRFISRNCLRAHKSVHSDATPYACEICGMLFARQAYLYRHTFVHSDIYRCICETCGQRFKDPSSLHSHKIIHSAEKPHSCMTCGKKFLRLPALIAHQRIHTGEKPFVCEVCDGRFRMKKNLVTHQRRKHHNF